MHQRQERLELAVEKVNSLFAFFTCIIRDSVFICLILFNLKCSTETLSARAGGDVPERTDGRVALLEHSSQASVLQAVGKRAIRIVAILAVAGAAAGFDSPSQLCRQLRR